jgi:hypothetical protein
MSPAFSSLGQAIGFVVLLLVMLLLPVLVPRTALPSREQIYTSLPWSVGPYPFIHDQIYNEKSDVDIAIIGDSQIWAAIDTPYMQRQLSAKLGRPAVVITLCCPWAGFDGLYFLARDLLQHRQVHMLVFSDASGLSVVQDTPHKQAWRWFRYAEDAGELAGLSLGYKLTYYYGSILGMPRNLISLLRPNLAPVLTLEKKRDLEEDHHWLMPSERLGSLAMQISFENRPDLFSKFTPVTTVEPSDFDIYSPETKDKFHFAESVKPSLQIYFARKLAALAQAHRTRLTCLNVPFYENRKSSFIQERFYWPEAMQTPVNMVGISPAVLFASLPEKDVSNLFWDAYHFNENGQAYFTRLLAPSLIALYDDTTKN